MYKVLVIDDDVEFCTRATSALDASGYMVRSVTTPSRGVAEIVGWHPDVVVLDLMLPRHVDGFGVLRTIRDDLGLQELPVVAVCSYSSPDDVPWRFAADPPRFVVSEALDKPVLPERLTAAVDKALAQKTASHVTRHGASRCGRHGGEDVLWC